MSTWSRRTPFFANRFSLLFPIIFLTVFLSSCSSSDDGGTAPPPASGQTIGPEGGTVQSDNGLAEVMVPAGALDDDVDFTIAPATSPPAGSLPGTAFDFGPEGTQFSLPATLALNYDPADLPQGVYAADLTVAQAQSGFWVPVATAEIDSVEHAVSAQISHFSTFGITVGNGSATVDSLRVYLTDNPEPGADDEFSTLAEAMAYLGENLAYEDLGIIVWQTSTAQTVEAVTFQFDLRVDIEGGQSAILTSPGTMQIDAIGAIDLSDFQILAPGGLVINANRAAGFSGVAFPGTSEINIGGVKSAPFPAGDPAFVSKSMAASKRATGANVSNCNLGNYFSQNLSPDTILNGNYGISSSTGNVANFNALGGLGLDSQLTAIDNFLQVVNMDVRLEAQASVNVSGNTVDDNTNVHTQVQGENTVNIDHHVSGTLGLSVAGIGSANLQMKYNEFGNGAVELGVKDLVWAGEYSEYVSLGVTALAGLINPNYALDFIELSVAQDMQLVMWEGTGGKLDVKLTDMDVMGAFTVRTQWENTWEFNHFDVHGYALVEVRTKLMDITSSYCNYQAGVDVVSEGVGASLKVSSTHDEFSGGPANFIAPPMVGFHLVIDESIFHSGANMGSSDKYLAGGHGPVSGVGKSRTEGSIQLTDVEFTGSGTDHFDITGVDVPVTVTGCSFTQTGAPSIGLALYEVGGAINISENTFSGGGIGLTDCTGSATISNNTMSITSSSSMGIGLGGSASVTIEGNTINCPSGGVGGISAGEMNGDVSITGNTLNAALAAFALTVAGSNVTADSNDLLSGMILIADGQLHISGNTITSCQLIDDYVTPGLQNDPVADNDGLLPGAVMTRMDWDGNGCCDYPPEWNQTDENGACTVCDGVSGKTRFWR